MTKKNRSTRRDTGRKDPLGRPVYEWTDTNFFGPPHSNGTRDKAQGDFVMGTVDVYESLTIPRQGMVLPEHYQPLMNTEEKIEYAYEYADRVAQKGLTPVAASVTGSRLRGVDTESSDVDGLVLVAEKIPKALSMEDDVSVQSLDMFVQKLSSSVPYTEFLHSPFMISDERITPFLLSQKINRYELEVHAERFVGHLQSRASLKNNSNNLKLLRNSVSTWYVKNTLSPLIPRDIISPDGVPKEASDWIDHCRIMEEERRRIGLIESDYLKGRVNHQDLENLRNSDEFSSGAIQHLIDKVVYKKYH